MPDTNMAMGHCLCGKVKVKVQDRSNKVWACHCGMCRRWGGGPLLSTDCGTGVSFEGEENISVYDSSDWAERGFCNSCGSHLFYRLKESRQYHIPVGIFESDEGLVLDLQVFIDEKPGYYCFSNESRTMTGEEVFAEFSP
jgi:hypothetical protein